MAQIGYSPAHHKWLEITDSDPMGKGSFPKDGQIQGTGTALTEGATSDSGKFFYREMGEGKELQAVVDTVAGNGAGGIMVRDSLDANSAFVFLGRNSLNELEIKWRTEAGGPLLSYEPEIYDQNGALVRIDDHSYLRLSIGRNTVYVYSSKNRFKTDQGIQNWDLQGAFSLELTGVDYGGAFADDASATFDQLIETQPLIWAERTTRHVPNPNDPQYEDPRILSGTWSEQIYQGSESDTVWTAPYDPASTDYVEFPLDINVTGTYELYVNTAAGANSTVKAQVWSNGASIGSPSIERDNGFDSWILLGKYNLNKDESASIRILATSGQPGETVSADAVRAVFFPVTARAPTFWLRDPVTTYTKVYGTNGETSVQLERKDGKGAQGWGTSGARSNLALDGDGVAQFRIRNKPTATMCFGLSAAPVGAHFSTIPWRFYASGHHVTVYGGATSSTSSFPSTNTTLSIERIGGLLIFRKDGVKLAHSAVSSMTDPLYLDSAFRNYLARIKNTWGYGKFISNTSTYQNDKDSDGFDDVYEWSIINADTEDNYQNIHDINPTDDLDGDGMNNQTELEQHGTNALRADTDGDGLTDTQEVNDSNVYGNGKTNPTMYDTDGDGLNDKQEVDHWATLFFDPTLANSDANDDIDSQGNPTPVGDYTEWEIIFCCSSKQRFGSKPVCHPSFD